MFPPIRTPHPVRVVSAHAASGMDRNYLVVSEGARTQKGRGSQKGCCRKGGVGVKQAGIFLIIVFLAGCVSTSGEARRGFSKPTQIELAQADYGPYPENYRDILIEELGRRLRDPDSLKNFQIIEPPKKSYLLKKNLSGYFFGYEVTLGYNAKNQYGGYAGWQKRKALIRHGKVIAMAESLLFEVFQGKR